MDTLNIYLPIGALDNVERLLGTKLHRLNMKRFETIPILDANSLRCLSISLSGTNTHVRAPYAFPFLTNQICNEYAGNIHLHPGVDWVVLGRGYYQFATLVAEHIAATGGQAVHLHPFEKIEGEVKQNIFEHDVPVCLARKTANYNQQSWEQTEKDLLSTPEDRWSEVCVNSYDMFTIYEPYIRQYLAQEPSVIVDIGCGLGQTTRSLASAFPNARVIGLDLSPNAINVARQAFKRQNLEFLVSDISGDLGLDPASVDLVVSNNALMYAKDQLATARHIFTFLHPDGLCINNCRMGPSHSYWDFPRSLLLPTVFQLQPMDWIQTAASFGFNTRILASPSALRFDPIYYFARNLVDFRVNMERISTILQDDPPHEYQYSSSHAFIVHSRHVQSNTESLFNSTNHLNEVQNCVLHFTGNRSYIQNNTIISWIYCFTKLNLHAEAVDFLRACLPKTASLLDVVFNQHVLNKVLQNRPGASAV